MVLWGETKEGQKLFPRDMKKGTKGIKVIAPVSICPRKKIFSLCVRLFRRKEREITSMFLQYLGRDQVSAMDKTRKNICDGGTPINPLYKALYRRLSQ